MGEPIKPNTRSNPEVLAVLQKHLDTLDAKKLV